MVRSKFKARASMRAVQIFTDRDEPRAAFAKAFAALKSGTKTFRVLMYYGVGGIGKTSLLRHLQKSISDEQVNSIFVNLEASSYSSFSDTLLDIRRQIPGSFPLFEYAYVKLLACQGRSVGEVKNSLLPQDSIIFDLQEVASDLSEAVAPARLIKRLLDLGYKKYQKMSSQLRDRFEDIDSFTDDELEDFLPGVLGEEIERYQLKMSRKLVVFIDSHEAVLWKDSFKTTKCVADEWLKELIGSADKGLYVMAGRERLRWSDNRESEWEECIEQHMLGSLSEEDSDEFLRDVSVTEPEVRAAIIESASGVPLYLDLCVSTYLNKKSAGQSIQKEDFRLHKDEVIERFLAHLDRDQGQALRVMSIPKLFDEELFKCIVDELNINYPITLFSEFCESCYTLPLQNVDGIFKIHDIVRDYVFDRFSADISKAVSLAIIYSAEESHRKEEFKRASWVFGQAWLLLETLQIELPRIEFSRLMDLAIGLIDAGQWIAIQGAVEGASELSRKDHGQRPIDDLRVFVLAYCARKLGRLEEAGELFDKALLRHDVYGDHVHLLRFHAAHVSHLLGRFDSAIQQYEKIVNLNGIAPTQIYARKLAKRQLYDVQMIKGMFRTAKASFLDMGNSEADPLWRAELLRFRGHIERFNLRFKDAEQLYREAQRLAEESKADAMLGKALTNLAETLCWVAPKTALEFAAEAIELNEQVQAPIEMGKAVVAQGLAFTFCESFDEAINSANRSYEIQEKTGYRNGLLFSLQMEGIARYFMGDRDRVVSIVEEMEEIVEEVRVYGFLKLPLLITFDPDRAKREYSCYEWLDENEVLCSHLRYMKQS